MRRIVIAVMGTLSGLVLLFSYHTSTNATGLLAGGLPEPIGSPVPAPEPTTSATTTPSNASPTSPATSSTTTPSTSAAASGTFTGDPISTRWGTVQVAITVTSGSITQSEAVQYPQGNGRDQEINSYALPVLAQEVTQAQSAKIDAVSGATVTSDGYIQSMQSALDQAHR